MLINLVLVIFDWSKQKSQFMKIIESQILGQRVITAKDKNARLFQVKQVLNQHRDSLITKLLKDIPSYLAIKYHACANEPELEEIKSKLEALQKRDLDLMNYAFIVEQIKTRTTVKLSNVPFLQEIDQLLLQK